VTRLHAPQERFAVRIQLLGDDRWFWLVNDSVAHMSHTGSAQHRVQAYKLALATLRGMIALSRVRRNAA
jgi:hypothetical protein